MFLEHRGKRVLRNVYANLVEGNQSFTKSVVSFPKVTFVQINGNHNTKNKSLMRSKYMVVMFYLQQAPVSPATFIFSLIPNTLHVQVAGVQLESKTTKPNHHQRGVLTRDSTCLVVLQDKYLPFAFANSLLKHSSPLALQIEMLARSQREWLCF